MVTHDRIFFDRVVNRTLEIDGGEGYLYTGNYSLFLQKREERRIAAAGQRSACATCTGANWRG